MPSWPVKPPLGAEFDPRSFFASRKITRFLPFIEGSGPPVDYATGTQTTLVASSGSPTWGGSPVGPSLALVGASGQYVNCGAWSEVSGVSQFTLIALVKRTTAATQIVINRGATLATSIGLALAASNVAVVRVGDGAADAFGTVAHSATDWVHLALVFDGTLLTNANRLKLYVDGVLQTLGFTGTVPAVAPTTSSSMRIGSNEASGGVSDASVAGIWLATGAAYSLREINAHLFDLWSLLRMPKPAAWRYGPLFTAPITVSWSNEEPEESATFEGYGGAFQVDITPTDVGNPINTVTATLNGIPAIVVVESLGPSGAVRAFALGGAWAGAVNTVEWTATTADANPNTYAYTYTARPRIGSFGATTDLYVPHVVSIPAATDYYARPLERAAALTDHAVRAVGLLTVSTPAQTDYAAVTPATGLLAAVPAMTDYYAVIQVIANLALVSAVIGEAQWGMQTTSVVVEGTERTTGMASTIAVNGTAHQTPLPTSAAVREDVLATLLATAAVIVAREHGQTPAGAKIDGSRRDLMAEYTVASDALQEVEEED